MTEYIATSLDKLRLENEALRRQIEDLERIVDAARGVLRYDGINPKRQRSYVDRMDEAIQAYLNQE
jgi:hypothetical protein